MNEQEEKDILLQLNTHENDISNLKHRMKAQEEQSKSIYELTISVKEMAINMKMMSENQEKQNKRLTELETKPSKRWEMVVQIVITTIVGAVIGFLLSRIGL